jgi:hypothetical protein
MRRAAVIQRVARECCKEVLEAVSRTANDESRRNLRLKAKGNKRSYGEFMRGRCFLRATAKARAGGLVTLHRPDRAQMHGTIWFIGVGIKSDAVVWV